MSSSKLVFELIYTRQQTGENIWTTCTGVFDEKSYQAVVMSVRNRVWGLVNRKRFRLRLTRVGRTWIQDEVRPSVRLIDCTSYEQLCLMISSSFECVDVLSVHNPLTSKPV